MGYDMAQDINGIRFGIFSMLRHIGDDPDREGLIETPKRVLQSYDELYSGYKTNPADIFKVFEEESSDNMIIAKHVELYSMCEHHILPFFGTAHIAYIPKNNKVIGISKLARLLDIFARRLQIQERIGRQVVDCIDEHLDTKGSACIIEAQHMCMRMRGVSKQQSTMVTSALSGVFRDDAKAREELMQLVRM